MARFLTIDYDDDTEDDRVDVDVPYLDDAGKRHTEQLTFYTDPGVRVLQVWAGARGSERSREDVVAYVLGGAAVDDDGEPYGATVPDDADIAAGSSRRRLDHLIRRTDIRVRATHLVKIADAIMDEATGARPTNRSAPSSRGPRPVKAGSTGSRSRKA